MHEMLQHLIFLCFADLLVSYWHAPETVYDELPVVQLVTEGPS